MKTATPYFLFCLIILSVVWGSTCHAQGIGINNAAPHASSILDVTSTNKGMLMPRMTSAQRLAIALPANGLIVYDISQSAFYFFNGAIWQPLASGTPGWSLTGNAGTSALVNFVGTTDNQPLVFRVNNLQAGYIDNVDGAFTGRNTFFGKEAGIANTAGGYENTFVGFKSGASNTLGDFNTALGSFTLQDLTTGYSNLALGAQAMMKATANFQNSAVGVGAMTFATSGFYNQAFGYHAMFSTASAGIGNNAFGFEALLNNTGAYNCGMGQTVMRTNTTGSYNCAVGASALYNNTSGNNNVAIGELSLVNNSTGNFNSAVGTRAMYTGVNCSRVVAIGDSALFFNTANGNQAFGSRASLNNTTGAQNTAVGYDALYRNASGSGNTVVGNAAGAIHAAYNGCTFVGNGADANASGYTNSGAFGSGAIVTANHQIKIGNGFVAQIGGAVNWSVISDGRFKTNVKQNVSGLKFINLLNPVTYQYDIAAYNSFIGASSADSMATSMKEQVIYSGFIAQEVEAAAAASDYRFSGVHHPENESDNYTISYAEFVVPLVKAVQELTTLNHELEQKQHQLEAEMNFLKEQLMQIKAVK